MATAPPPPKPSSSPSRVSAETVQRAVTALIKWRDAKSRSEKPKLLDHDEFVYLILTLKRIPQNPRVNPFKIPLPHPLFNPASSEVCLIIDDRPKSKLSKEAAMKKIKGEGIPISKVLKLSKLRANYKPFESKRKLCDSYDLFLADKGVVQVLPKLLGKQFFNKKKIPIGLDLRHASWKGQVERVFTSGLMFLGSGTCSVVRVGRLSMSKDEIVENVLAAIDGVAETVPRKWANVRSLHLKFLESLALPVYQTVPDVRLKIKGLKDMDEELDAKEETKEGSNKESVRKSRKGRMREVRYMDIELNGDDGNGDDGEQDTGDLEESEDEEADAGEIGGKKRKKGKELGSEKSLKKKKSNKSGDNDDASALGKRGNKDEGDVAEFLVVKHSKKQVKSMKQGKSKKEGSKDRTKIASSVDGGEVSGSKKYKKKKKGDKLMKSKA